MLVNLNDVLKDAQKNHYGVGLFNTTDTDMLEAAISAAEELRSPIVIGTAEVLLPAGELKLIAPSIIAAAKRATVPVVVHYDHGLTFDRCIEALKLGFSSIMFDGSAGDPAMNFENTREMVKIAHAMGVTVEGEIGHVGQADTGDNETSARAVAEEAGISQVHAGLLPQQKLDVLSAIREEKGPTMFVGDGINDAPVLAGADVGAAMGSGADAAIEAADVVYMTSDLQAIPDSIAIARSTQAIAWQNVVFALAVKAAVMVLGLLGFANMWMAVFADSGVAMLCVLNSIRLLYRNR